MSEYTDLYCLSCKEQSNDLNMNHGWAELHALILLGPSLAALKMAESWAIKVVRKKQNLSPEYGMDVLDIQLCYRGHEAIEFIIKHWRHGVVVVSEYGYIVNEKGENIGQYGTS